MKKLIVTILCITCCITFGATFSNANSKTIEKYIYAQDWNYNIRWQDNAVDFKNDLYTNKNLDELLKICKDEYITSDVCSHYPYLAWNKFENVKIYESNLDNETDVAMYIKRSNIIVINMYVFEHSDTNNKHLYILHELAHCLTSSEESTSSGGFNEPVAELITYSLCNYKGIDFDFSYRDASMIYMMICNCYGLDESIHDFYYGTLITNLNSITNNYGDDLASILYFITHHEERKNLPFSYNDLLRMAEDIAIHANINKHSSLNGCSELLVIDDEYFTQLISRNL